MASSDQQSHYSGACKPHFHQHTMPLCARCVAVPTQEKKKKKTAYANSEKPWALERKGVKKREAGEVSVSDPWLISGSRVRTSRQERLRPHGVGEL